MLTNQSCDVLIIGSGIIGLSIGVAILEAKPNAKVLILEKEKKPGLHASGRNSGVIHAGFYYSPDSLKAKFCREGNLALRQLAQEFEVPVLNCGKIVVAQSGSENESLDQLMSRGEKNGVEIELLNAEKLPNFEPLAVTKDRFLWSPTTAVSDPTALLFALRLKFEKLGGKVQFSREISMRLHQGEVITLPNKIEYKLIINAAGAQSLKQAKNSGAGANYLNLPFLGMYRIHSQRKLPLTKLVYPVPHPVNPFLGVHFTITIDGKVKIGPSAIPIIGVEQYDLSSKVRIREVADSAYAAYSILSGSKHNVFDLYVKELLNLFPKVLLNRASRIVPTANETKDWKPYKSGIRGQLVSKVSGELVQDFLIEEKSNAIHVLNTVSPGWTSAIPFGKHIVEKYVLGKF